MGDRMTPKTLPTPTKSDACDVCGNPIGAAWLWMHGKNVCDMDCLNQLHRECGCVMCQEYLRGEA